MLDCNKFKVDKKNGSRKSEDFRLKTLKQNICRAKLLLPPKDAL